MRNRYLTVQLLIQNSPPFQVFNRFFTGGSSSKKQNNTDDHEKPRLTNAIRSFPDEVHLCRSSIPGAGYGVCAKEYIPLGTWIGPYEGSRLPARNFPSNYETGYLWEVRFEKIVWGVVIWASILK